MSQVSLKRRYFSYLLTIMGFFVIRLQHNVLAFMIAYVLFSFELKGEIVVIVNSQVNINSLSLQELQKIYLGNMRTFPNGESAVPILNTNTAINEIFLMKVLDKNMKQFNAYWNVRQFTGNGTSPHEFRGDDEVKNWVLSHVNAIGFIDSKSMRSNENRIRKVCELP